MKIAIAANNGDVGGGEVMLLAIACEARALGHEIIVVAPENPDEIAEAARKLDFRVEALTGRNRLQYMTALRRWWFRSKFEILWCNGLLPAVATSGMKDRVVHLHQIPSSKLKVLTPLATFRSLRTLVPSEHMRERIQDSEIFPNWSGTTNISVRRERSDEINIGFIGRFSSDKGLPTLIRAANLAQAKTSKRLRLILAGQPRFVDEADQELVADAIAQSSVYIDQIGWINPEIYLSKVDLAIVPSVWQEPFGLVATEAMSAKVPLIVTDAGALPDIVGQDYPWIARAGDEQSLSELILQAMNTSLEDTASIVECSYDRWQRLFSPEAGRRGLDSVLKSLGGM